MGLRLRNQDYLHVLYASQVALYYTVGKPKCKQASLRNSTLSLIELGVEPLGSLNKGFTVRTTRRLPFNVSYACTFMQESYKHLFQSCFSYQSTPQSRTLPGVGPTWFYLPYSPLESKSKCGGDETRRNAYVHMSNHPELSSNHLQSSNLSLYRLLALLQGSFKETRDEQCACCIRDRHTCGLYLTH